MPQTEAEQDTPQLIRLAEVTQIVGLSRSSIWRLMGEGRFPKPTRLSSPQCTRWNRPEVIAWVEQRLAERGASSSRAGASP